MPLPPAHRVRTARCGPAVEPGHPLRRTSGLGGHRPRPGPSAAGGSATVHRPHPSRLPCSGRAVRERAGSARGSARRRRPRAQHPAQDAHPELLREADRRAAPPHPGNGGRAPGRDGTAGAAVRAGRRLRAAGAVDGDLRAPRCPVRRPRVLRGLLAAAPAGSGRGRCGQGPDRAGGLSGRPGRPQAGGAGGGAPGRADPPGPPGRARRPRRARLVRRDPARRGARDDGEHDLARYVHAAEAPGATGGAAVRTDDDGRGGGGAAAVPVHRRRSAAAGHRGHRGGRDDDPRGEGVFFSTSLINRDTEVYEHPEALDWDRPSRHHLAFGFGVHQCLGQNLARTELDIALRTLFERLLLPGSPCPRTRSSTNPGTRSRVCWNCPWHGERHGRRGRQGTLRGGRRCAR